MMKARSSTSLKSFSFQCWGHNYSSEQLDLLDNPCSHAAQKQITEGYFQWFDILLSTSLIERERWSCTLINLISENKGHSTKAMIFHSSEDLIVTPAWRKHVDEKRKRLILLPSAVSVLICTEGKGNQRHQLDFLIHRVGSREGWTSLCGQRGVFREKRQPARLTFFRLYPAWKMIGGSKMLKNTSGSKVTWERNEKSK